MDDPPAASRGGGDSGPGRAAAIAGGTEGSPTGGEQVRGRAGLGGKPWSLSGGPRAPGTRAPRDRRAARPGLRRPFPAAAAAGASAPLGGGAPGPPGRPQVHDRLGSREVPGSWRGWVACSEGDADVGFLNGV